MGKYSKISIPSEDIRRWVRKEFTALMIDKGEDFKSLDIIYIHNAFKEANGEEYSLTLAELKAILDALCEAPASGVRKMKQAEYALER